MSKKVEKDIPKSKMLLQEAQQLANIGSWELDLVKKSLTCSDEVYRIFGIFPGAFKPSVKAFEDAIHPDDLPGFLKEREKKLKKKQSCCIDHRIILPNGDVRFVQERTKFITDAEGKTERVIGTIQDITKQKLAEEKLKLHENRLNSLLNLHRMNRSSEKEIFDFTLEACLNSTQSEFAFIGTISEDNTEMITHAWSRKVMKECSVGKKPLIFSIAEAGLWGEVIRQKQAIIVNDYKTSKEFIKGYPKGHIPLKRFLGVPVFSAGRVVFVSAVANKAEAYDESDVSALTVLVNEMWNLIERKKNEEKLKASEEKYATLVENGNDGIIIMQDNVLKYLNSIICKMTGFSKEELIEKPFLNYVSPGYKAIVVERYKKRLKGYDIPNRYEIEIFAKDGKKTQVEVNASLIRYEGKPASMAIIRDITEHKNMEEALRESEEHYRTLIENIDLGIMLIDRNYRIIMANSEFCRRTGVPKDKAEGKLCFELSAGRSSVCPDCPGAKAMALKKTVKVESECSTYDGSCLPVIIHAFPIFDENNKAKGFIEITEDISEYKKVEKAKNDLIRNLSHGLKTPVSMIEMSLGIIKNSMTSGDKESLMKAKKIAEENIKKVRRDINGILYEFSMDVKKEILSKDKSVSKRASLKTVMKEVVKNIKSTIETKKLKLNIRIPSNADKIKIQNQGLKTLLDNLFDNAMKFTKNGGISIISRSKNKMVEIRIRDTGCGISGRDINRVFDRFYKRHASIDGTGLGLPICKELVEIYKGKINISSEGIGKGTTVTVSLPKA